jgi:hypothetical protein
VSFFVAAAKQFTRRLKMCDCFEAIVICKGCRHGAKVYRNPNVKVRKSSKDAPAIIVKDDNPSPEFVYWASVVCKNPNCSQFNKSITLTYNDFMSLNHPLCCGQKMKPEIYERIAYVYKCEVCNKRIPLAKLLPDLPESLKK